MRNPDLTIGVKQFRVPSLARSETFLSYCVWDRASGQAAFVDPHFSAMREYADFVSTERLRPVASLETQLHYSHPTASRALSSQFDFPPQPGQKLELGSSAFELLRVPGVRPDARVLYGAGVLFTGETIWAGAVAGFGMPGADLERLWESLQSLKRTVAARTIVFPGYDVLSLAFSTWATELERNPDLRARDRDELSRLKTKVSFHPSDDFQEFARFNADSNAQSTGFHKTESPFRMNPGDPPELDGPGYSSITAEKLAMKLEKKPALVVDIRDPDEFARGHIGGSKNVPFSELPFAVEGFRSSSRVYVVCQMGRRSTLVATTLSYLGMKDVVILTGGFQAWQNAGLPVEKE